jgi:hypothetical protein
MPFFSGVRAHMPEESRMEDRSTRALYGAPLFGVQIVRPVLRVVREAWAFGHVFFGAMVHGGPYERDVSGTFFETHNVQTHNATSFTEQTTTPK